MPILRGKTIDFPIASCADDYTFRPRRGAVFIGESPGLARDDPHPFHLPGVRMAAKKKAKKKPAKRAAKKRPAAKKKAAKRKPNAAFMKPVQPDGTLSAVVGSSPM